MRIRRRTALFTLAALVMASAAPAQAQIKGLEIIAPANPGSGFDQTSRAVQAALTEAGLASGIQVLNVPGAGGTIGLSQLVSGQPPDHRRYHRRRHSLEQAARHPERCRTRRAAAEGVQHAGGSG